MAWSRTVVGVAVAFLVSRSALAGGGKGKPSPGGGAGTPEAWFTDLPSAPTSVDDVAKRFDGTDVLQKLAERIPNGQPAAGGAAMNPSDPQLMDFMGGWMDVGKAAADKMYKFTEQRDAVGVTESKCVDAEMQRNVPSHHDGLAKCENTYLSSMGPLWIDYAAATHELVVAKADYIAKFRTKAKSAGFKSFLDGQYQGLWIHPSNLLAALQDLVNHGHVPVN